MHLKKIKEKNTRELVSCKREERTEMKKINKNRLIVSLTIVFVTTICILQPDLVYAGGLSSSKAVTGTKQLANDAIKVVQVLAPIVAGLMAGWNGLKLSSADDDEVRPIKKRIKICIIGGVLALIGATIISVILSYYQ